MNKILMSALILSGLVAFSTASFAAGSHVGFGTNSSTDITNGNSGNSNGNLDNSGTTTTTTTTTGPSGALKNDKFTPNQETTTTTDGPGNSKK